MRRGGGRRGGMLARTDLDGLGADAGGPGDAPEDEFSDASDAGAPRSAPSPGWPRPTLTKSWCASDPFGAPTPITELNTMNSVHASWISPDLCHLYYIGDKNGYDVYFASRARL